MPRAGSSTDSSYASSDSTRGGGARARMSVKRPSASLRQTEHRLVDGREGLALPEVHVHPARQAGIEAPHRAHDVDALEVLASVLLEDLQPLHGVLVGPGRAE